MSTVEQCVVKPGHKFRLADFDPDSTLHFQDKETAAKSLPKNVQRLSELHDLLYADHRYALLIVLQGMDAGGKDGAIRHVMPGVNPQGCDVTSFKAPSAEEADHDYLWRVHHAMPARGEIGIFNRSHYEDVLVVRVHKLAPHGVWSKRYGQINAFEQMLSQTSRSSSFFSTAARTSRRSASRSGSRRPPKTGNFRRPISLSVNIGASIRMPTRTHCRNAAREGPPGT